VDIKNKDNSQILNAYHKLKESYEEDKLWFLLCMSLIDNKEEIEEKAYQLANKHGVLKALKLIKKKKRT